MTPNHRSPGEQPFGGVQGNPLPILQQLNEAVNESPKQSNKNEKPRIQIDLDHMTLRKRFIIGTLICHYLLCFRC